MVKFSVYLNRRVFVMRLHLLRRLLWVYCDYLNLSDRVFWHNAVEWIKPIIMCDGVCSFSDFYIFSVMKTKSDELSAVSRTHGYRINFVPFVFWILVLLYIVLNPCSVIHREMSRPVFLPIISHQINFAEHEIVLQNLLRHTVSCKQYTENCTFTRHVLAFSPNACRVCIILSTWRVSSLY